MTTAPRMPLLMVVLAVSAGLTAASVTLLSPSLPAISESLGASKFLLALMQSAFLLAAAVMQLVFGRVYDRFGGRLSLIAGLLIFTTGSLICLFASGIELLIFGRVIQGGGAAAGMLTARALLRGIYPEKKAASALGYLVVAMMVFPMFAPILGGYIQSISGWRGNFAVLACLSVTLAVLCRYALPRSAVRMREEHGSSSSAFLGLLRNRNFLLYAFQAALLSAGNQLFFNAAPFTVEHSYGLGPSATGSLFVLPALGYIVGNFVSARLSVWAGIDGMIRAGAAIMFATGVLFSVLSWHHHISALELFLMGACFSIGHGLIMPNALTGSTGVVEGVYGSASGLSGFMQMATSAAVVLFVIPMIPGTVLPLVFALTGLSAINVLLTVFQRRQ